MAIYHCSVKTIGRSKGRSAVNSAAYRSAEKLYDERLGKTFSYSGKNLDIMYKEIMAPDNAPDWVKNREELWNKVEASEKRKDSQLAREVEISLPREFTVEQNIALVKEYVQKEFVDRGMIADVCLHYGKMKEDYNPHAHVMLTMRDIGEEGFGKKNVSWNSRELLEQWRESWAELTNKHLALNGFEITVDHRTLKDQGIGLEAQNVELPNDAKERLNEQRDRQIFIMRENGERLKENPEIVLEAITRSKSTFTDKDIARYLNTRTADEEQFREVFYKVKEHPSLVRLVCRDGVDIYTTKEMLDIERAVFASVNQKAMENSFGISDFKISEGLSLEQRAAVEYLCQDKDFRAVVGYAGTGKTFMLKEAREIWERNGYSVKGAALSGIAAKGLMEGSGIESKTVARRFMDWDEGRDVLGSKDVLVIDEAGMLGGRAIARLVQEAELSGAKLVMLGDPQQLQAIEAGAAFRGIVEREGCFGLSDIRRQKEAWQRDATKHLAMGEVGRALDIYEAKGKICEFDSKAVAVDRMVEAWSSDRDGVESSIMLAYKRDDVKDLNERARVELKAKGELRAVIEFVVQNGKREFAVGDRVCFLKNDNGLVVRNGTFGRLESIDKDGAIVVNVREKSADRRVAFNIKDYDHLDHGYAVTVHKSQGATVEKSYVLASRGFDQHITYVAMSRHEKDVNIFWGKDEFEKFSDLKYRLSRESKKDNALDYVKDAKEFAEVRGIEASYKDIFVSGAELLEKVKEAVKSFTARVKEELALDRLEERREFNLGIERLSSKYNCHIDRDIRIGEKLKYFGNEKIANKDYALMKGEDMGRLKIVPFDRCQDLKIGNEGEVYKAPGKDYVIAPSPNELWSREVHAIKQEFGKDVSMKIEHGDTGIYRGAFKALGREYAMMESYDKVTLVNKDICYDGMRKGHCMKIEKVEHDKFSFDDDKFKAVHDVKRQQEMQREMAKERVRERDMGMSFGL